MAESGSLTIAVLAAGQSRRFGPRDKLAAPFRGKPLGMHVCDALARARFALRPQHSLVIAADEKHPCAQAWKAAGFEVVRNPNADEGMGTSVAVAARIAGRSRSSMLMIALADMPLVPVGHYRSLAAAAQAGDDHTIIASSDGTTRTPPAVFGEAHFDALTNLTGDVGARALLAESATIPCDGERLIDIDTPETLAALT